MQIRIIQRITPTPIPIPQSDSINSTESSSQGVDYSNDLYDHRSIYHCEVLLFGAGSGGSHLASCLGHANLQLKVIDPKPVEEKHLQGGRTWYERQHIGMLKPFALKQKLERLYPGTEVTPLPYDLAEISNHDLTGMLTECDLAIIAIDDPVQIERLSDLAYHRVELIQQAMHAGAASGHIAISIPLVTPCLKCTLNISKNNPIRRLNSEPGSGMDILAISQATARIALEILYCKVSGKTIQRWDPTKNLLFISNTKQQISPDGMGMIWEDSKKRPGCPVCNIF
jgi:molybdopterin/thiamine biosynthesis adenylyltransferase